MKFLQILLVSLFIAFPFLSYSQEGDIDAKMQKMASQMAQRIRTAGKSVVRVINSDQLFLNKTKTD